MKTRRLCDANADLRIDFIVQILVRWIMAAAAEASTEKQKHSEDRNQDRMRVSLALYGIVGIVDHDGIMAAFLQETGYGKCSGLAAGLERLP